MGKQEGEVMSGQTLLVLTVLCLANVGLSQPIESANDPAATPAPTPEASKPNEAPTTPAEEAAGEGAGAGHEKIDEAIKMMNNLNDLFQTIVDSMGHGPDKADGGEAKGEETTAKTAPAPAAGNTTPAPAAGGDSTPAPAAVSTPAPDAGKSKPTTVKAAAKKQ